LNFTPVKIDLGPASYWVHFQEDWPGHFSAYEKLKPALVTDRNVSNYHLKKWKDLIPEAEVVIIPPGENSKSAAMLDNIYSFLIEHHYHRDTLIIALGGGVVGDLAGYAAATYMRGVYHLQIPTTLLAMVDSAIGGKVGIDHRLGKNMIGAFKQPISVWIDFSHLATLPAREWYCGMGEVLKYCLISKSLPASSVLPLFKDRESINILTHAVRECVRFKGELITQDEKDLSGKRAILNFGHTIGHALEAAGNYDILKHGEAVVIGMTGAVWLSHSLGLLPDKSYQEMLDLLDKFPFPEESFDFSSASLLEIIRRDKKVKANALNFILLKDWGEPVIREVSEKMVLETLEFALQTVIVKTSCK